jgi:fibronectin-binding autotransporter adhesin
MAMHPTSRMSSIFATVCRVVALLISALLATGALPASAADMVWVGGDSQNTSNFTNSGNWQNNTPPTWGYSNSLRFSQNLNSNVTGLNYNYGSWQSANDIVWDMSFPVSRTLSASNGGGIGFKTRIENNSSFTQTVAMEVSGGQDGAPDIQLNPVNGSLIFSGTLWNDFEKDYVVWGGTSSTTTTLTLDTALGTNADPQSAVDFTVSGGRNSNVQVNASQVWAGTTTVNSGSFITANGVTLASSAIVVAGGTVATTSANTFVDTATLTVNSGRLSVGGSDTVASLAGSGGTVDIASGATLTAGNAGSTSYAGSITGSGGFTKVGSGTFTLSAASSYTGATTVTAGQLSLGGANLLADTSAVSVTGGALGLGGNSDTVGSFAISGGALTGSGTMTAATYAVSGGTVTANLGAGTMNVTGNAALNGTSRATALNLNSGTLALGSAGRLAATTTLAVTGSAGAALALGGNETIGSLAGAANVALGSSTLTVGGANTSTTYSGGISGAGGLTKSGSGTLTLTGSNGFTGGAALNAGTLAVGSANALGSAGTISFGGGTLQYSASNTTDYSSRFSNASGQQYSIDTNGQDVTLASTLAGNGSSVAKLGLGTLLLTANNTLTGGATISQGTLQVGNGTTTGNLSGPRAIAAGARLLISNTAYSLAAGWSTITGAGTLELDGGSAYGNWGSVALPSGFTGTLQVDNAGRFDVSGTSALGNASAVTIQSGAQMLVTGIAATFSQAFSIAGFGSEPNWNYGALRSIRNGTVFTGPVTLTGNAGLFTQNDIGVSSMTLSGNIVDGGAGYGLTIRSDGINNPITLSGSNSFSGDTLVTKGVFNIGGRFALAGSTLDTSGSGSFSLTAAGTNTYSLGGLKGSKAFAMGANSLEVGGNGQSTTYSGILSGSGGFSKVGNGTLTLSGSNSYTGGTTISGGRLVGTTASLQGAITNNAAVTFDMATSGTYEGRMTGPGSLTKTGAGTLTLSNTTVYTGPTALDGGVIALASINALQATSTISFGGGTLQYSANNTLDYSDRFSTAPGQQYRIDTNGQNVFFMRPLTSVEGSLVKLGAGNLQMLGTNSYSGGTTVSAGELQGTVASLQGDIINNATVSFLPGSAGTYAGSMSGTGSLKMYSAGELVLAGANTYSGGTVINSGKIKGSTSGVQGAIQNYGVVEFAQATSGTYSGVISGTGAVTKSGGGILAVTAANTYAGLTSVIDGGLKLNGSIAGGLNIAQIATLSGTGTVGGNATIIGTHSPGNSPGAQTFNANLTYEAGALVNWELIANTTGSAGVNYDQIIMPTGNLTFSGSTTLALAFDSLGSSVNWSDSFWNVNRAWTVYDLSGGTTSNLSNLFLGGSLLDSVGNPLSPTERGYFTTSLSGQDVMLNFVAVPEPASLVMTLIGLGCGASIMRRRRPALVPS